MIAALRSLGHDVKVVAPNAHGVGVMGAELGWVARLRALVPWWLYELAELAYSLVAYFRLARAARAFQPDLIYERYNLFLLSGLMAKSFLKIPLILEVNSPLAEERQRFGELALRRLARWTEQRVWRGADHVFPVTRVLARRVTERGVPAERVTVISNGVNVSQFAKAPPPDA